MDRSPSFAALRIAGIYTLAGALWIIGSDRLIETLVSDLHTLSLIQTYKGWALVLASGLLIFFLLSRELREREQDEKMLRESERRFRALFETATDAIMIIDIEGDGMGKIVSANPVAAEMHGYELEELLTLTIGDLDTPEAAERVPERAQRVAKGEWLREEIMHRRKDGSIFLIETTAGLLVLGDHKYSLAIQRDISERKRAEEALRESEAKYRFLAEHASDLLWTLDLNLRTTFVSPSIEKVLGFTPEERMRQRVEDQLRPESLESAKQRLLQELQIEQEQGVREGQSMLIDLDYLHKDGSVVCLQTAVAFIRDENGTPTGVHGISRNITELKRSQEALRESEEKYRTVVEESFDGVLVQKGTVITFANSRLHEMLGYEPGELEGLDHWTVYHPDFQHITRTRAQARLKGEPVPSRYEVNLLRKDGTSFPGELNAKVILFDNEPGIQVWIRDLTEQKRLEKRLIDAQKMEAVGTLAGGIAHDFNNLLHIISGHAELVEMELAERRMGFEEISAIRRASDRGAELVKQILTFSRRVDTKFESISLNEDVRNTERLLYRTIPKMIEIDLRLEEGLLPVRADSTQMEQMLINLAVNAKDAMPEGGKLTIETHNVLAAEECRLSHVEMACGQYVRLRVSDTGHGMTKDVRQHIFEPFYTTKGLADGTGLGLATVFGIVKMHGGHINCESEVGQGTTFEIYLPVADAAEAANPEGDKDQDVPSVERGSETILVVDDEPMIRDLAKRMLERSGYSVIVAGSGKEGVALYAQHKTDISLVILDLIMPEMGGTQCLEQLLNLNPMVKVLIATGFTVRGDTKRFLETEAKGTVPKPFNMRELLRSVRHALDGT